MTRKILLTGSTGSVGSDILSTLKASSEPYEIYLINRRPEKPDNSGGQNQKIIEVQADLEHLDCSKLPTDIDILINCAGVPSGKNTFENIPDEEYHRLIKINITAPFKLCRMVLPYMRENKFGRIVNVNSIWGLRGSEKNGAYHISKHAMSGLTRSIAKEYGKFGITCNDVCPGAIDSKMIVDIATDIAKSTGVSAYEILTSFHNAQCRQSMVRPSEVTAAIMFLIGSSGSGINGQSLVVDTGTIC